MRTQLLISHLFLITGFTVIIIDRTYNIATQIDGKELKRTIIYLIAS